MRARLASVAAAMAILSILVIASTVGPIDARATSSLPSCRYEDLLTSPRGYEAWSTTLVDTILSVPSSYVPPDLVPVSEAGLTGSSQVRAILIDSLRAMRQAASAAGAPFGIESAYRSYADQQKVFDTWVRQFGYDRALMTPARPGHSEHQLGVAIDVRSGVPGATASGNFGSSAAGKWLAVHAWEYGFVMSYPKGATAVTCYDSEPWHFRYFGRSLAAQITASGLTVREYLWTNFTTTVVPPQSTSSGPPISPDPSSGPTPIAGPSADPSPTWLPDPPTTTPLGPPLTAVGPATPVPTGTAEPIDPAVAAGAQPVLVLIAAITFTLIIGAGWLAARHRRPGGER